MNRQSLNAFRLVLAATLLLAVRLIAAPEIKGIVSSVHDGDTITITTTKNQQIKIRLHGINAPEIGETFASESKYHLTSMVLHRSVRVVVRGRDRYGRTVGTVYRNGRDINAAMVYDGWAEAYTKYSTRYLPKQRNAMAHRRGMWMYLPDIASVPTPRSDAAAPLSFHPSQPSTTRSSTTDTLERIVYVTRTGTKHHALGCRYLSRSCIPMKLKDAIAGGYTPCSVCGGG